MTENQENRRYSDDQILAIEKSLSSDRFNSYLLDAEGDRSVSIRGYERNIELSEALFMGSGVC